MAILLLRLVRYQPSILLLPPSKPSVKSFKHCSSRATISVTTSEDQDGMVNIPELAERYTLMSPDMNLTSIADITQGGSFSVLPSTYSILSDKKLTFIKDIQAKKKYISMALDMQLTLSDSKQGNIMAYKEILFWILSDEEFVNKYFQLYPDDRKAEVVSRLRSKLPGTPRKKWTDLWYVDGQMKEEIVNLKHIFSSSGDPPVEQSFQAVVNKKGHKFNMTEDEYNLWKDMDEELKDKLIQMYPQKAEVVGKLRSEAREGKAKAASPASQEHTNLKTGGGSSTAQNEPAPNHQGLPVGGDHQFHNVQVNGSINQTVNYAPESSDMKSGTSSTLADNEPAEHTNLETGGGSSTAQNEPAPNHQSLYVGGNHQLHNVQVNGFNQTVNYAPESSDMESGTFSTQADNEPAPDKCGHETTFQVLGTIISIALAVISVKKSAGEMTIVSKIFLYFLIVCILVGIIFSSYGLCLSGGTGGRGRRSIAARSVNAVSYVAIGLAVVTSAALQLPNQVMVWVMPMVSATIVPAIVGYAMKQ